MTRVYRIPTLKPPGWRYVADADPKDFDDEDTFISKSEVTALLAGAKQFTMIGTDACPSCSTGRVTLYASRGNRCFMCDVAVTESKEEK